MTKVLALRSAAFLGFVAVGLAAFGAHGLKELLARNGTTIVWESDLAALSSIITGQTIVWDDIVSAMSADDIDAAF